MSTPRKPFRLAIVGAGLIAREAHLPAALSCASVDVVAIVDPVPGRAAALAQEFGLQCRTSTMLSDVLSLIDGAVIATPNDSHSSIGLQCIRAGVAVLIEKPLCTRVFDGELLVGEARKAGITVATGYATRFRDTTLLLKELLELQAFGPVRRFVHQFGSAGGWAPLSAYNLHRKVTGGGVLVVTGTHFLDRMLYFWGLPNRCALVDDGVAGPEANATATFWYGGSEGCQFSGVARYSKTAPLPGGLVIDTEAGVVTLADADSAQLTFFPRANPQLSMTVMRREKPRFDPLISPFVHQLIDFMGAVREKRDPLVDGEQGLASVRLLEQLYTNRQVDARDWYPKV
jgi:predicted dehydrogenase